MSNLKHADRLLQHIADGLAKMPPNVCIGDVEVVFVNAEEEGFTFPLANALDAIANDLYWDERGNWAEATKAHVCIM